MIRMKPVVRVRVHPHNLGAFVRWEVANPPAVPGPWTSHVYEADNAAGPWALASTTSDFHTTVGNPYLPNGDKRYYRVEVRAGDKALQSMPTTWFGDPELSRAEYLQVREMLRRITAGMRAGGGQLAQYRARKTTGPRCKTCADPLTGEPTGGQACPECLGTGFSNPYHKAVPVWSLFITGKQLTHRRDSGVALKLDERMLRLPAVMGAPQTDDIIGVSNSVYRVVEAPAENAFRDVPISYALKVSKIDNNDPEYALMFPGPVAVTESV